MQSTCHMHRHSSGTSGWTAVTNFTQTQAETYTFMGYSLLKMKSVLMQNCQEHIRQHPGTSRG